MTLCDGDDPPLDDPPFGESQAKISKFFSAPRPITQSPESLSLTVIPCRPIVMWKPSMPIVSDMPDLEEFNQQARQAAIKAQAPGAQVS
jgi:hypothetical protein